MGKPWANRYSRASEAKSMSVLSVVKVRIHPSKTAAILSEAFDVLQRESKELSGFLAGEILVSVDKKIVVILTEWVDSHAWSRSRYDGRVGKMLENCLAASPEIEFEIYDRHAKFSAAEKAAEDSLNEGGS